MTNPEKVVCSSEDYLLSETDDPRVFFLTRRDEGEFDEDYSAIAADMFQSFICLSMFNANQAHPIFANYSFGLSEDKKAVRIYIISQEELSDESADNSESADSHDDYPSAEEISALIERKKKEKSFWYKLKKIFVR